MIRPIATIADPLPLLAVAATLVIGAALVGAAAIVAITGPRRPLAVAFPALALVVGAAVAGWFTPVGVTVALLLGFSAALAQRRWLGEAGPRREPPDPVWASQLAADHRRRRTTPDEPVGPV